MEKEIDIEESELKQMQEQLDKKKNEVQNVSIFEKKKQEVATVEEKVDEKNELIDGYFDQQLKQSLWQTNFTISHDNYFDKDYASIEELKAQAEIVRAEIKK